MVKIPFLFAESVFAAVWVLCRAAVWFRQKRIDWKREALLLLMYVNLAVLLRLTFFPLALVKGHVPPLRFNAAAILPFRTDLVPFARLLKYRRRSTLLHMAENILMFIPSGILLPFLYRRLDRFWKAVGVGALMSLGIELAQLLLSTRMTDVNDLIMNTLGAAVGYGLYALMRALAKRASRG